MDSDYWLHIVSPEVHYLHRFILFVSMMEWLNEWLERNPKPTFVDIYWGDVLIQHRSF